MASRPPDRSDEQARNRWTIIQLMRVMGAALVLLGILMTQGTVDLAGDVNREVGYGLVVVGLLDGFFMPIVLARKWRSPRG